ncbi:mitogen-activated protein kinase-binding protein 1 isoform X3 [Silurus asotus]|uniref:Mitogen-activated protein kinase-binding protein 1 isoform X3 n=1 Tax=Silurus asotus TaxID=30991 RepID=A0AAD5A7H1_SILAS|nr:mitogen-activated protein kinase-binding protein 1 isoform X3 [Silurus asotus]
MENSTLKHRIKNLLRSPSVKLKKNRRVDKDNLTNKLTLERVLGITTSGSSGLTCDPCSGVVAYPAGCVIVLLNPAKNRPKHIINTSRKTITALAFSTDGKYLVTGEYGHLPAVRVWDVADGSQVAELHEHKYGVTCVAFSPNNKYIVSIGYQHVNVWAWKKNMLVAANKVSSKVTAVSFSEDSSYFVTSGNRHVRYWYLEPCTSNKQLTAPVPLLGRSGLLGELQNNNFCDVACGRGEKSKSTYCITSSGLLCEFNEKRMLDKWVDLRTITASALCVTEELIFCACAEGTVRVFSPTDLHFICTLPRPHHLGIDISAVTQDSHLFFSKPDARYPDSVAVTYDPVNFRLSCVYNDHSLYVWDVQDLQRVGKVYSGLYHAACVWDVQIFPEAKEEPLTGLTSSGLFFSCSSDSTVRMWSTEPHINPANSNLLSNDLRKVIYTNSNSACLLDTEETGTSCSEKPEEQPVESRTGIRTICVSPNGKHLASGDRNGTLRIHDLNTMEETLKAEVHDSEILCLEYSKPETASEGKVRMISCGADKSVYFRTAHWTFRGVHFKRTHHIVRKSTLHDMAVDPTCKYAAVGSQDRNIRVFNISSGKQKKCFKGSQAEDGSLLRVQLDPSGLYMATSCSDKNLSLFDFQTGECLATMYGHSESELDDDDDYERSEDIQTPDDHMHQTSLEEDQGASDDVNDLDCTELQESSTGSSASETSLPEVPRRRKRWNCRMGSFELMVKSMLELRQFDSCPKSGSSRRGSMVEINNQACGSTASLPKDTKLSEKQQTPPDSSWSTPASSPELKGVVLSSELCTGSFPGTYQLQEGKRQCQQSHSPDRGSSMGYASGGSSPELGHEGSGDLELLSTDEDNEESARGRPFHKPESPEQECFFMKHCETMSDSKTTGACNETKPPRRMSDCFLGPRRRSQFLSKTDKKSEKCVFKPLVSTVHPLQKDNAHGTDLEERADKCSSEQLHSASKRRKICKLQNVTSPTNTSRVFNSVDMPLLKPMSALSFTANSQKCVTTSLLKHASRPSTPELLADRNDSIFQHPSPTGSTSPQPRESPNTIRRFKVRSYMSPTTSSRAKVSRSMSLKEGLHLNLSSGQTFPCSGSSPSSPSRLGTPLLPSLSAPLSGSCNQAESRLSLGGCPLNTTAKITKARASARMSNPLSEYPSRSTLTPSTDSAAVTNTFAKIGAQHVDKSYTKGHVELTKSASPIFSSVSVEDTLGAKTLSHTPQRPLVDTQAYNVTCMSRSDQAEPLMNLETCRQAASELYNSVKKVTQLYSMVSSSVINMDLEHQKMAHVLMKALFMTHSELEAVPGLVPVSGKTVSGEGEEKTLALLEQYSQLLLQSVEKRLEHKI